VEATARQRVDAAYGPGTPRGFFRSLKTAYSIAAVLAVAFIGLSFYTENLQRQHSNLRQQGESAVSASTAEVSLSPGNRAELETVTLAPGEKKIPFSLVAPDIRSYPEYALKVFDASGKQVLTWNNLDAEEAEEFHFTLDSSILKPGTNTFRIFGIDEGKPIPLMEYHFMVHRQNQ
jgi:uncharacterized protein YqjF (DUF2071 family)